MKSRRKLLLLSGLLILLTSVATVFTAGTFAEDEFTVSSQSGSIQTIAAGSPMFSDDSTYVFSNPPKNLTGLKYVRTAKAGDTYTAVNSGWVYVLTTMADDGECVSQRQRLLDDGFTEQDFSFAQSFCAANQQQKAPFKLYGKYFRNGARFTLEKFSVVLFCTDPLDFSSVAIAKDASHTLKTAAVGEKIWSNAESVISAELPEVLRGLPFLHKPNNTAGTSIAVRRGYIYTLAPVEKVTGFTKVDTESFLLAEGSTTRYNVFYRLVKEGDSVATGNNMVQVFSKELLPFAEGQDIASASEAAFVKVIEDREIRPFHNGEKLFLDRNFLLTDAPAALTHLYFPQGYIDGNQADKQTTVEIRKSGKLYALGNAAAVTALQELGFAKVYDLGVRWMFPSEESFFLLQKDTVAGETYTINTKWGIFLFSSEPQAEETLAVIEGLGDLQKARIVKIAPNARLYRNRNFFMRDDIPEWLYGKSYLQPDCEVAGSFRVTKAGTVYLLINRGTGAPAGFEQVNYPEFELSYSLFMRETLLYAKDCAEGEVVDFSANCIPVFAPLPEEEYIQENAQKPATVINLADPANEDQRAEYAVQDRNFQGCATVAVTEGGRYFYGLFTGGDHEPHPDNYSIVMLGDETGLSLEWDPLLVIRHMAEAPERVRVEDVQLWMQPGTNRLWIFWTNSGCIEDWNDTWSNFDHSLGVWASVIENPDVENLADLKWTAPKRISDGLMRNKPTVLANGDILVCAYDAMNNAYASVYTLGKEQIDGWIADENAGQWEKLGSVYAPDNSVFDEHQIVELSDGTLWMLMRSPKGITQSYSYDGGKNWTQAVLAPALKGGDSRFYVAKLPENLRNGLDGDILFVNHMPPTGISRSYLSAMILNERGEIVHGPLLLEERACSYPDVEFLSDGRILTAYDRGRSDQMELLVAVYRVEDIVAKAFVSEGSVQKHILSKSYKKSPMSVAESAIALSGEDIVLSVDLPARTLTKIERLDENGVVEEVPADLYSLENGKLIIDSTYFAPFGKVTTQYLLTAQRYDGSYEQAEFTVTVMSPSTAESDFAMESGESGNWAFVTGGNAQEVFTYTTDQGRSVLKLNNPASGWTHDSAMIADQFFGDVEVEATWRREAGSKTGFPVIVMRKTSLTNTHEQVGGGIGFAFLKEGSLVIYDTETSSYQVSLMLPQNLYRDNEYNTARIIAEGNRFLIFLNDTYVLTYTHTKGLISDYGFVGMASSNGTIFVDRFAVRQPSENSMTVSQVNRFYDFKTAEQLADFESYYTADDVTATKDANVTDRWTLNTAEGRISRKAQVSDNSTKNITSLYLKDLFLSNFDMSVDFRRNTENFNWLTLVGRARVKGLTYGSRNNGGGGHFAAFMQREGIPTFRSVTSGGYKTGTTVSGYDDKAWHNLRVVCVGMEYRIYLDYNLVFTYRGNDHDALGGFLGMMSHNNVGSYSNFSVTALDNRGNPIAIGSENNRIKIATVGDSITYGAGALDETGKVNDLLNYPSRLAELFGEAADVRNFGISGRKLLEGRDCYTIEPEYAASLRFAPDVVFIMLGTNDIKSSYWTGDDVEERYMAAYAEMIASYREANPDVEIFVMTSPYLYTTVESLPGDRVAEVLVPLQREVAIQNDCHLIDIFTATSGMPERFPDLIHPDAIGYKLLAQTVYEGAVAALNGMQLNSDAELEQEILIGEQTSMESYLTLGDRLLTGAEIFYRSENPEVAAVDASGNVVSLSAGQTQIIAYVGDLTKTFSLTVSKYTPEIIPSIPDKTYVYGNDMPLISSTGTQGIISFAEGQTLIAGEHEYQWVFTPFESDWYETITGTITIRVEAAIPSFETPVVQKTIAEGSSLKLSDLQLPEGFAWVNGDQAVTGSGYYDATYTKDSSGNYKVVQTRVYVHLTVEELEVEAPFVQITVEEGIVVKLSDLELPEGFAWTDGDTVVEKNGYYDAVYTNGTSSKTVRVYVDITRESIDNCTTTSAKSLDLSILLLLLAGGAFALMKKS